jgi:hypothetical protein
VSSVSNSHWFDLKGQWAHRPIERVMKAEIGTRSEPVLTNVHKRRNGRIYLWLMGIWSVNWPAMCVYAAALTRLLWGSYHGPKMNSIEERVHRHGLFLLRGGVLFRPCIYATCPKNIVVFTRSDVRGYCHDSAKPGAWTRAVLCAAFQGVDHRCESGVRLGTT